MIACGLSANSGNNSILAESVLQLKVQAQPSTFTSAGQVINYAYTVTNSGTTPLTGPVTVTDNRATVLCPELKTVGNKDDRLDQTETIACAAGYSIAQTDVTAGNVTSTAQAHVGGIDSNPVNTVVGLAENKVLTISVAASPLTFSQANQTITYTYTVKNAGAATLGPTQFVVRDDHIPTPINCGPNNALLATNESVTCQATYTITQNDVAAGKVTNTATASGGSAGTIQAASITVTTGAVPPGTIPGGSTTIVRGSTIQHIVTDGEWLWQITRCYGADLNAVLNANRLPDPNFITIDEVVTVPNVGSVSTIFGPPCIAPYTVKSGDTWDSIASDPHNNADKTVLIAANPGITLSAGKEIVIPLNSKFYGMSGYVPPSPTPEPIRLNFSSTSPSVTLRGNITAGQTIRHQFTGATGQVLTVKLSVPGGDVKLAVYGPNNTVVKAADTNTSGSWTLNANGEYFIDLINAPGTATKDYIFEASLTTPTPASPFLRVADINTGVADSKPSYLTVFNGQLFFQATGSDGAGAELWKYDATQNAPSRVADINAGAGGSNPAFLMPFQNMLYFSANGNDAAGVELWRFNGTNPGRVGDINPGNLDANPMYLTVYKDALYFSAKGGNNAGTELWKFDGANTTLAADINPGSGDSNPAYLAVFKDVLYFSATSNDSAGTELWKFDGTKATRAADINNGIGGSSPAYLTPFSDALYFSANGNDNSGNELWKFDGTTATRAADIVPGPTDSIPTHLAVFNNALYFSANGDASGFEIWKFDGTTATRVSDINVGNANSNPAFLTPFNNELYFQATGNDNAGAELWKYKP
jgi:uncharacterized repeat protein (TIGR01451 family)